MLKRYDKLFSGGFFLLVALIMITQIPGIEVKNLALNSRVMPIAIAIGMILIGVILLIQGLINLKVQFQQYKENPISLDKMAMLRVALCFLLFVFLAATLRTLGFVLSASVYLFGTILVLCPKEKRSGIRIIIYLAFSVAFAVIIYYVFVNLFYIMLPYGSIWPR